MEDVHNEATRAHPHPPKALELPHIRACGPVPSLTLASVLLGRESPALRGGPSGRKENNGLFLQHLPVCQGRLQALHRIPLPPPKVGGRVPISQLREAEARSLV